MTRVGPHEHQPPPLPRNGIWRTFTAADGLAGLQVESVAQDTDGFLWFACLGGLSRFDGDTFTNYDSRNGLTTDHAFQVYCDRRGRLWVVMSDGVVHLYEDGTFRDACADIGISEPSRCCLYEDRQERLWLFGRSLLGYHTGDGFHDLMPAFREQVRDGSCYFTAIAEDDDGALWLRQYGDPALIRTDDSTLSEHRVPGMQTGGFALAPAPAGGLWVGESVHSTQPSKGASVSSSRPASAAQPGDDPPSPRLWHVRDGGCVGSPREIDSGIRRIRIDREGRTWVATSGSGVLYLDAGGWRHFDAGDGLGFPQVNDIHQDTEAQLWFATFGGGVSCYDPHTVRCFSIDDGLPGMPAGALCQDCTGRIWTGIADAAGRTMAAALDDDGCETFGPEHGLHVIPEAIAEDAAGLLWLGGPEGLASCDGSTFETARSGSPQDCKAAAGHTRDSAACSRAGNRSS